MNNQLNRNLLIFIFLIIFVLLYGCTRNTGSDESTLITEENTLVSSESNLTESTKDMKEAASIFISKYESERNSASTTTYINHTTEKTYSSTSMPTISVETTTTSFIQNENNSSAGTFYPLLLYSNDGKDYLGKLVTNKYDSESIWNEYGDYGSQYQTDSIWNEYGDYGSKYSSKSAFNKYASDPPKIVDSNGKFFGYLTANEYKSNGYTIEELRAYLEKNGQ